MRRRFLFLLSVLVLALLSAAFLGGEAEEKPYVLLVSIDGFRFDYAERFKTANILAIRNSGAAAESMIPSFPSVTFPNHVSIVTGLYPEHHGIVGNSFIDPQRHTVFNMRSNGDDGSWYEQGTPLWVLAEQQHMISACMFWPTCDAAVHGVRATYWQKFEGGFADEKRVNQVIDWLKLPAPRRPHFVTLYFGGVDAAGHEFGPESPQTAAAVQQVDRMIGKLRTALDSLKLPINLILVSDHGMQDVLGGEVSLAGEFDASTTRVAVNGPVAFIYCKDSDTVETTYLRMKKNPKLEIYKRAETPVSWHFNENPRAGDLVAIVKGAAAFRRNPPLGRVQPRPPLGEHGYDPKEFPTMRAIFYAVGPNIRPQSRIPSFENVNVYPLIARILGLQPPGNLDGSAAVLDAIYRP